MEDWRFNLFAAGLLERTARRLGTEVRHVPEICSARLLCAQCQLPYQAIELAKRPTPREGLP